MGLRVIYPGTFDPMTHGHLDLLSRACSLFEHVIVGVAQSKHKKTFFSLKERVKLATQATANFKNIEVNCLNGLLIHFAQKKKAFILLRGIRSVADFEHEWQLCHINHHMMPQLETIFLMPSEKWAFISSSLIKEIARHQGDVGSFVPNCVKNAFIKKGLF